MIEEILSKAYEQRQDSRTNILEHLQDLAKEDSIEGLAANLNLILFKQIEVTT